MIFEQYSYKTKFKALFIIFIMLGIAGYKRSFSNLINVINENKELNKKVVLLDKKAKDVEKLTAELSAMDNVIGKGGFDKEKIQQSIIQFAGSYNVSVYDLQPIHIFNGDSYTIYTNQIDLTGNINELLKIAYDYEKNFTYSKPVSISFYTIRKNNKPDALHLKIIFQNYENIK